MRVKLVFNALYIVLHIALHCTIQYSAPCFTKHYMTRTHHYATRFIAVCTLLQAEPLSLQKHSCL